MTSSVSDLACLRSANAILRIDVQTPMRFQALMEAFEKELGHWDATLGAELVEGQAQWDLARESISAMAGEQGLMIFAKINQGEIASLAGTPRFCTIYLVGNAVIATEILKVDIRAGMLVPFRVQLYEKDGSGYISYDLPSSFLASLGKTDLVAIGRSLDEKIASVARRLSCGA